MNIDYHTKEFTYTLRPDDIIEINTHKDFDGNFTLEKVDKNLRVLDEVIDAKPRAFILHFPDKYVNKEVLKKYSEPPKHTVARAFLASSFAAKLIGNLYLTLIQRFAKNQIPSKIFSEKEEAILWLKIELKKIR
jgi:hypothetical protein